MFCNKIAIKKIRKKSFCIETFNYKKMFSIKEIATQTNDVDF